MKNLIYAPIILSIVLLSNITKAQTVTIIKNKVERALGSYYNTYGRDVFSLPKYKNKAYTFGFAISVNKTGKIDTIIFSNHTKSLDSLVSFKEIIKRLKTDENIFANEKNTVLLALPWLEKAGIKTLRISMRDTINASTPN